MVSDSDPRLDADRAVGERADIHVLLVDDDESWVALMAKILERQRDVFTVETATSLSAATDAITDDVDCIVCDYDLETGTGLDLLADVRDDDDRPFILVTGHGNESIASDAIGNQVTDYIPKRSIGARTDLLARRIESAVDSYRTRQALARERRGKDAMLDIVTAASTREDISREFCDHLVTEREYECAWIGTTEQSPGIVPRAVAGTGAYLDAAIERETTPKTEPAFVAVTRGETHVVSDLDDAPSGTEWRDAAAECGFESAAATPISHDGMAFGVLAVYKSTPKFSANEVTLLEEYGRLIGYTLRSAGWKESLLSATPTVIEFELEDERVPLVAVDRRLPANSRLEVLTTAPREETLLYVLRVARASESDVRDIATEVDAVVESTITRTDGGEPIRCELVVSKPTPESVLATHGAEFVDTTVEDGCASVTIRRRSDQDHQSTVDELQTVYPDARLRTVRAADANAERVVPTDLFQSLTDKQRRAIELAYFYGYFERPREHNTTEVAEKLGCSRQTFTQHLRAAERKLLSRILDESDGPRLD